jgi:hypothetical protein
MSTRELNFVVYAWGCAVEWGMKLDEIRDPQVSRELDNLRRAHEQRVVNAYCRCVFWGLLLMALVWRESARGGMQNEHARLRRVLETEGPRAVLSDLRLEEEPEIRALRREEWLPWRWW